MSRDPKADLRFQIDRLERRHGQLSDRVVRLEQRSFLSANDQLLLRTLKKEKLAAKDALTGLKRA